ncbi:unnamed protein product [Rhodiola kirilowii]
MINEIQVQRSTLCKRETRPKSGVDQIDFRTNNKSLATHVVELNLSLPTAQLASSFYLPAPSPPSIINFTLLSLHFLLGLPYASTSCEHAIT